jgi:hypothetical protein
VEVYGAAKPASSANYSALDGSTTRGLLSAYDAAHHSITALVPDAGKGLEIHFSY